MNRDLRVTPGREGSSTIHRRDFLSGMLAPIILASRSTCANGCMGKEVAQDSAITELAGRLLGSQAESIRFESIEAANGRDVFEIETPGDRVVVRGNSPVSQARGLNHYLRSFCNAQVSWTGDQLELPERWPQVTGRSRESANANIAIT